MTTTRRYDASAMEWQPLEAIIGRASLEDWMWMGCSACPDTGVDVHFYKHLWSRRYLRLDADGHVYKELVDGTPVRLRGCGGGILVLLLLMATASINSGMPATIALPDAAREPCTIDDLPELADVLEYVARDLWDIIKQVERQSEIPSHIPL